MSRVIWTLEVRKKALITYYRECILRDYCRKNYLCVGDYLNFEDMQRVYIFAVIASLKKG